MNYRFNIEEWLPMFPLQTWSNDRYHASMTITGPYDICNNEQLRRHFKDQFDWGPSVPVDLFIMADGEPENRSVTKIGGLPYRPASLPWPRDENGTPFTFLAQVDFTDSLDIVGNLPGDVLLIFMSEFEYDFKRYPLHFEWQPLGLENLVGTASIPYQNPFESCFGHIFRTVSYPQAEESPTYRESSGLLDGKEVLSFDSLFLYNANQIGLGYVGQTNCEDTVLPGRPLCTIAGVWPKFERPYPFVNHPQPIPTPTFSSREDYLEHKKYLGIGDLGGIHVSMDHEGKLHANYTYS